MATTVADRKLFVAGDWIETGDWIDVASPYDGSLVARVAKAGPTETRSAIDAAERAMRNPLPAHKRAEILVRVAGALGRRADEAVQRLRRELLGPNACKGAVPPSDRGTNCIDDERVGHAVNVPARGA